ncbi:MAG: 3-hydroxyacyl-CoA dehydrogenase [Rhodobacteraceae bacterium HLUCCO07]|nr:MAG: 3-hydroxyacyl-CoA dehydrogenase [Rhodobacteraceae bacterium HLUCCO07]
MAQCLSYEIEDEIAILRVTRAPGLMDRCVIDAIDGALDQAQADGAIAIVIAGEDEGFPGGPPLSEIMRGPTDERLGELCSRIACFEMPVVGALKGDVCDGALSLALAAHARVAHVGTKLGFREIRWGLCPYAGATQRLPRFLGAKPAIELMLSGRLMPAEDPVFAPLFDRIVASHFIGEAKNVARDLVAGGGTGGGTADAVAAGLSDPIRYQKAVAEARRGHLSPEAKAVVDCVEAAQLLPFDAGMAFEKSMFDSVRESTRAAALVHVAQAEGFYLAPRQSAPRDVVVFGESRMARELALASLDAGAHVHLAEQVEGGSGRLIKEIEELSAQQVKANRMTIERAQARLSRLTGGRMVDVVGRGDIVIEAGGFPLSEMEEVSKRLCSASKPDVPVLLGSNVALRAEAISHLFTDRVVGVVFQPPPSSARLTELVVPRGVPEETILRSEALIRAMNNVMIPVAPKNGCLFQALVARFFEAAEWCVRHGASPWQVERALGWRTGPFMMMDREGLAAQPTRLTAIEGQEPEDLLNRAFTAVGRNGVASGRGFFRYDADGGPAKADPQAEAIIERWRKTGPDGHGPGAEEIRQRILLALVSLGLELLESGIVTRGAYVDLVAIHGLGMPRSSGGPMKWAESVGLVRIRKALQAFNSSGPRLWSLWPVLDERIKNGTGFDD